MNKKCSQGISAVIGIVILTLLVLVLSAGVLFAAQTLVGDQPNQMVGGMTEERVSPYEQRVSLVSQGNANNLTVVSPLGTEYNLSQVGDSQLYLAVSSSVSGAQDPQILGVKNGERQVLTSNEIRDGIPADTIVDKHGTGDYTSIQDALNNTKDGDIIVVEKATYNENIDVPPTVSLIAEHGTIIQDQNPAEPVVSINNGNATIMNFIIDADPVPGDNHYASHGILVKGRNTEVIGNTILNATSPAGDSAGLRVENDGVVARYNNFKNNEFSLSVSSGVGSVQLCSNQLDGGLHGSFSKSTYETFVMRNYWNKGVPSTVLNNVLSNRPNITATDVSRNAVNFNKVFETSNNQEILASKSFPGTRLFGGAPCGVKLSFTNKGNTINILNASINYEIRNVTYNVTFNEDSTATLVRGNNSTTTSYSVSGNDMSWEPDETLSISSPDSGSSDTSGVWSSGGGGGGGASFWGGGTGGGLSGGSLFGGGGGSFWGVSSGTTSSDVKVTKSPTNTTASVEQSPPENVTETEKQNVTVDLGADFKATVGDEISLDAVISGGTSPYNYTWELGDGTTSYSKSVTHIYDSTGNYTISLNVTDADGQSDTDSITVWIRESTTTTKTKNESLTLNEQVNKLSPGETLRIPSGSYNGVNVDVSGVVLVGDGDVTINGLSILSDNVKVKNIGLTGPVSITGSDFSMYNSDINNTGNPWAIEIYNSGAYFNGVSGKANNGMYIDSGLQDIQFEDGKLTAYSGRGVLVRKHTGIVEVSSSHINASGAGIYREHGSQLYLSRNLISASSRIVKIENQPPQATFVYNDAPRENQSYYGVYVDASGTSDPEGEPLSFKWDLDNDGTWEAYGPTAERTYSTPGTYNITLSVTDYHGETSTIEREITVDEHYLSVSSNVSKLSSEDDVEFSINTNVPGSEINTYKIDYDGDGVATEISSFPDVHSYSTAGNYTVTVEIVTDTYALSNSTEIQVLSPPTASFTTNNSNPTVNDTVEFDASGSSDPDTSSLSYSWDFDNDGIEDKTGQVVSYTFNDSATRTVKLTVSDGFNTDSTSKQIEVTSSSKIPGGNESSFTVNPDGCTVVTSDTTLSAGVYEYDCVIVESGVTLTLEGNTSADSDTSFGGVKIIANDSVVVKDSATITAKGQGYSTGSNPGPGYGHGSHRCGAGKPDGAGGGAYYGGEGGDGYWWDGTRDPGSVYGTTDTPTRLGSAGGDGCNGDSQWVAGGGAIWIQAQNVRVNGLINADGNNGNYYDGGGSGGSIYIESNLIEGNGTLTATGGDAGTKGGGGGGGRISLDTSTLRNYEKLTVDVSGGSGWKDGQNGTIYDPKPEAIMELSATSPTTTATTIKLNASNSVASVGGTLQYYWDFDNDGYADSTDKITNHSFDSGGVKTISLTVQDKDGRTSTTSTTLDVIGSCPTFTSDTTLPVGEYNFDCLTVANGATLTLEGNESKDRNGTFPGVKLHVSGTLKVEENGKISANAQGYSADTSSAQGDASELGPGYGHGKHRCGAGKPDGSGGGAYYGGEGGDGYWYLASGDSPRDPGTVYSGTPTATRLGSAGGNGCHSGSVFPAGGGAIWINASTTIVNGEITADGANGPQSGHHKSGGGSGGSIRIETETLEGSGLLTATGGDGGHEAGGGGGGRIYIEAGTDSTSTSFTIDVSGGSGWQNGSAGVITQK